MECWWLGTARAKLSPRELSLAAGAAHGDDAEAAEALLHGVEELLDSDEFSDYMQRPLGETIARLCKTLGLDPDWVVEDGDG